jgi:hypothetical protein
LPAKWRSFVTPLRSPIAAVKALIRHQSGYAAHGDPTAAAINIIALMLAWNGPLYPVYVVLLTGRDGLPWCLATMLISPFFYAVPWLSRISSRAARLALPIVGAANTLWCMKLFGVDSGVGLFLFPCIVLTALLYRYRERWLMFPLLGLMLLLEFIPARVFGAAIILFTPDESAKLAALNAGSVAFLLGFIVLKFIDIARALDGGERGTPA